MGRRAPRNKRGRLMGLSSSKMEPLNMHGHANTWQEELLEVAKERDELRAEIERLQTLLNHSEKRWRRMARALARAAIAVEWDGERCLHLAGIPGMAELRSALRVCFKEAQHE